MHESGRRLDGHAHAGYAGPLARMAYTRLLGAERLSEEGALAEEVPVALVYNQRSHAVMMCTPADLEDFAVGFTVSEGICSARDISELEVVRHDRGVEVHATIPEDADRRLAERRRMLLGRTGCGLCGIDAIDEVVRPLKQVVSTIHVSAAAIWRAERELSEQQVLNRGVHAIHAAAWAEPSGAVRVAREDVGRHNALDKVLGSLLRHGIDPASGFVMITSRASFELVQKTVSLGVPLLASVSRPTALAIRLAEEAGQTLVGLVRGESANLYCNPHGVLREGGDDA